MTSPITFDSIVIARVLGLEKKDRKAYNIGVEKFLIQTIELHGLNTSDIVNIALEKYLRENHYLTDETLNLLKGITILEKEIFKNNIL